MNDKKCAKNNYLQNFIQKLYNYLFNKFIYYQDVYYDNNKILNNLKYIFYEEVFFQTLKFYAMYHCYRLKYDKL